MRSVHRLRLSFALISAFAFTGCLDDGGGSGNDTSTGRLNFNGFNGLNYRTASQTGTTNMAGEFSYYPGETLEFRVGDLKLAQGVPAQKYVTLLEFFPEIRAGLKAPRIDNLGLRTHTLTEAQLIDNVALNNLTRFLIALNWSGNVGDGEGIDIRKRVIKQINAALPELSAPIDFTVSEADFTALGATPSPANELLAKICFYPEGSPLCDPPPTQQEIDSAPPRPDNEDNIDPDITYSEDLAALRSQILDSMRTVTGIDNDEVRGYLRRELKAISTAVANRYFLDDDVASYPASDTEIKQVALREIGGDIALAELEAISTRPQDVQVHSADWQSAEVEYFLAGPSGGESELLMSFRPEGTYRWVRKPLRVIIR